MVLHTFFLSDYSSESLTPLTGTLVIGNVHGLKRITESIHRHNSPKQLMTTD